jgi:hypothetical protein
MPIQEAIPLTEIWPNLNPAQRQTIEQVLRSHDQVQELHGGAGVGNTTTLVRRSSGISVPSRFLRHAFKERQPFHKVTFDRELLRALPSRAL